MWRYLHRFGWWLVCVASDHMTMADHDYYGDGDETEEATS